MRVFYGQGAQVSAGVYGGGVAAAAAHVGAVQVHPEGEEVHTLDVLATTTHTPRTYRLLRWWHEHRTEELTPMFRVPWVRDGAHGRFTASSFELKSVTPSMVYLQLTLNPPDGVGPEDVRAAVTGGEVPHVYFQGTALRATKSEFSGWGRSKTETVCEFSEVPFFWGSSASRMSSFFIEAKEQGSVGLVNLHLMVEFNGEVVLKGTARSLMAQVFDNGETAGTFAWGVGGDWTCADVGRVRITASASGHYIGAYVYSKVYLGVTSLASGQQATHEPLPLEVA